MSSHIDHSREGSADDRAKRAVTRARLAPLLGLGAGIIGLGVVGAFLTQSIFIEPDQRKPIVTTPKKKVETVVSGQASKIAGYDKNKQPFELAAVNGIQDSTNLDLVHLQTVTGTFHRADGGAIGLASNAAQYDSNSKLLSMQGKVILKEAGRYTAYMDAASVNVDDHSLVSQTRVKVDTSTGTVEADTMTVGPYGGRIIFKGHVKAVFETDSNFGAKQ
jgi:hypothetical protein